MNTEEAKEKLCPIDNHPEGTGYCKATECMWWQDHGTYKEKKVGECVMNVLADSVGEVQQELSRRMY